MKLNTHAFPYPVLTGSEGVGADYKDSAFQCGLEFATEVNKDLIFDVNYEFMLSNEEIADLIQNDQAGYAIEIRCPDTLKREIFFLEPSGAMKVNASELYGKVDFTPMVVVKGANIPFTSVDLNDEFEGTSFNLSFGDIVAIDDTWTKYIEFNNLSFDSLIKVDTDPDLEPLDYKIEQNPSFIYIWMGTEMREIWHKMRHDKTLKPALAMSIYKDVVFLAIEDLIDNSDSEDHLWARSLRSYIEKSGLLLPKKREFNQINLLAQKLVQQIGVKKLR